MGLLGVSLALASLLALLIMFPQSWRQLAQPLFQRSGQAQAADGSMPPPPPPVDIKLTEPEPEPKQEKEEEEEDDEATTPKAGPTTVAGPAVPTFSLSSGDDDDNDNDDNNDDDNMPPPMFPSPFSAQRAGASADPSRGGTTRPSAGMMMPPPVRPSPLPNRGPPQPAQQSALRPPVLGSGSGGLAPPPSTTALPARPVPRTGRNKVMLTPGHSPLDWARLTADPVGNNLRGKDVPPDAPAHCLLRITPSQLRQMNGRRGRDAWTALGGMVYNITPYVPFHPGGAGELLRCAGKDGNKLFSEVHSWVNYDNMLAACRVGILVDEGAPTTSPMEEMD